jgi:hypothetical protein
MAAGKEHLMIDARRTVHAVVAGLVAGAAYHALLRPRLLRWGATADEVDRPLPGDGAVPRPRLTSTRAVTVAAAPRWVWPWLAQLGDGRGGLYSYDWLDRTFGYLSGPSAERILPEHQDLRVGDVIPLGRGPSWPVTVVEPGRALVVEPVPGGVTWCWALEPAEAGATRLISRVRVGIGSAALFRLLGPVVDAPWFMMERKMLLGIRRRAEAAAAAGPAAG